ncbi:MAG: hypothetical protein MUE61_10785 [Vicinamibacterales bacterium]|nr:hypothetical protein [Vicinamibacterales bacterium]
MRRAVLFLAGAIVLAWLLAPEMDACTAFCLKGERRHADSVACAKGTQASRNRAGPDSGHGLGEPARWTHPIPSLPRESPPSRPTARRQASSR